MIEELRKKIKDYYGTAMQFNPVAAINLASIDNMTDEEIVEEAKKLHLIK